MRKQHLLRLSVAYCILTTYAIGVAQEVKTEAASSVTQTHATLAAEFVAGSTANGFQFKYGNLVSLTDFSSHVLSSTSDPVTFVMSGTKNFYWREAKGWAENERGLAAGQESVLTTTFTLTYPTAIEFDWCTDSEEGKTSFTFFVDGEATQHSVSGLQDNPNKPEFRHVSYMLPAGKHTVMWKFAKKGDTNTGGDIGILRNIHICNTTPDKWITKSATSSELTLNGLYPSQDYLYRAYSIVNGDSLFSGLKQFATKEVSIGEVSVTNTTQATATVTGQVSPGDAEVERGFVIQPDYREQLDDFGKALVHATTVPIKITSDTEWKHHDDYIYCTEYNYFNLSPDISLTFTSNTTTTITFDWEAIWGGMEFGDYNSSSNGYYESLKKISRSYPSKKETCSVILEAGTHTLSWIASKQFDSQYNVKISNLVITTDCQQTVSIASNDMLHVFQELQPNTAYIVKSYMRPTFESELENRWSEDNMYSAPITFNTRKLIADTLSVKNLMQGSAVIRGKVDGGDANIIAKGLQYKTADAASWSEVATTGGDAELSAALKRLRPNTKYKYRSYIQAQNCDTVFSQTSAFTTLSVEALQPSVTACTQHTATIEAQVVMGDAIIYTRGLQFRKRNEAWTDYEDGGEEEAYTRKFSELAMNTMYEARTYIQPQGLDTIYSDVLSFSTKNVEAYIDSITDIYPRKATVHGRISTGDDAVTEKTLYVWKKNNNSDNIKVAEIPLTTSDTTFTETVTGLTPGTLYYFQSSVKGSTNETVYSELPAALSDDFTQALLSSDSDPINITHDNKWEAGDRYVYTTVKGASLNANFTLKEATTVTFDWKIKGYKYPWGSSKAYFYVDGVFKSLLDTNDNDNYNSRSYSITLDKGEHTLMWECYYASGSCNIQISNLNIQNTLAIQQEKNVCRTPLPLSNFKCENTTQTTASFSAIVAELGETPEEIGYTFTTTTGEENKKALTYTEGMEKLDFKITNLYPESPLTINAYCKLGGVTYPSNSLTVNTLPVNFSIDYTDIKRTSARMNIMIDNIDAEVENLRYYLYKIESLEPADDDWYTSINESALLTELTPATYYYPILRYEVNGRMYQKYMYEERLITGDVTLNVTYSDIRQTTATMKTIVDKGDAIVNDMQYSINGGAAWQDMETTANFTGLAPDATYRPMFRWTVSGISYTYTAPAFQTKAVTVSASVEEVCQTSALISADYNTGNATYIRSGVYFNGDYLKGTPYRLTNLSPATTYSYRVYVMTEEGGTVMSAERTFTTPAISVTTESATNISNRSAQFNGTVQCDAYSDAIFGFEWKGMGNDWLADPVFTKGTRLDDGTVTLGLVSGMLEPNKDYQFRTIVKYQGKEYAGSWKNFHTELEYVFYAAQPVTLYRTDRETNNIVFCGYYIQGSEEIITQGYEYWQQNSQVKLMNHAASATTRVETGENMQYILDSSVLTDGVYCVRAFVQTATSVYYGQTLTFSIGESVSIDEMQEANLSVRGGKGYIIFRNTEGHSCRIFNINGNMVAEMRNMQQTESLPLLPGIYIVRFDTDFAMKVIIK